MDLEHDDDGVTVLGERISPIEASASIRIPSRAAQPILLGIRSRCWVHDPTDPNPHVWERAAVAIERYRVADNIDPDEPTVLGPQPPTDRSSTIERPHVQTLAADRTLAPPRLADDEPAPELTNGWEP